MWAWWRATKCESLCVRHALQLLTRAIQRGGHSVYIKPMTPPAIEPDADKPRDEVASDGVTEAERHALMEDEYAGTKPVDDVGQHDA